MVEGMVQLAGLCPVLLDRWNEDYRNFSTLAATQTQTCQYRKKRNVNACSYTSQGARISAFNSSEALHCQLQSLFDELQLANILHEDEVSEHEYWW